MEKRRVFNVQGAIPILLLFMLLLSVSCSAEASHASPASSPTSTPAACESWTIVNSPTPGNYYNSLNGVAAVSDNTIWTVGSYANASGPQHTLIEYWNGNAWKVIKSPNPSSTTNAQLFGVAALSKNDAWAVGTYNDTSNTIHALIEHWNGSSWSIVDAGSRDYRKLIEHWNGEQWSLASGPTGKSNTDELLAITRVPASKTVWATGFHFSNNLSEPLIERNCSR